MAHQHPKLDTRERRRSDRSQKGSRVKYILYAALALFSIKILAVLTLKQEIFLGNVPSTEDPQKFQHKPELVEGWGGIMQGIPSAPRSKHDIHVVFSTDCSAYQNYQSIILFNTAETAGQTGAVTRIASGCTEKEQEDLQRLMDMQPGRFRVHFTPDYSLDPETGNQFMFYNKPNGMAHFLKNAYPPVTEAVIALVDPDMILMSALTPYVGDSNLMLWLSEKSAKGPDWVVEGYPVGQFYGLGGIWAKFADLGRITENLGEDTPAREITTAEAAEVYPVGPPYLMHPRDWARVIDLWVSLAPKVYKGHPSILAEMYAFCIAAAHLRLRHRVAQGLMVSDTKMSTKEGWPLVDVLGVMACDPSVVDNHRDSLPPIVHYCQLYRVGTYKFGKRHLDHQKFFSCDADSYQLPPPSYLLTPMVNFRVHPKPGIDRKTVVEEISTAAGIRQGYAICAILQAMNVAQVSYKKRYCRPEEISGGVKKFTDLQPSQLADDTFG